MSDRTSPAASAEAKPIDVTDGPQAIDGQLVVQLHHEEADVLRRRVETAVVRVETTTRTREALVDEPVVHERVEIERIPVGRVVDAAPPVREEDGTTIIPVIEEIIVVERRLVLKEEIHLRRVRVTAQHRETVVLREQEALITRGSPNVGSNGNELPSGVAPVPSDA